MSIQLLAPAMGASVSLYTDTQRAFRREEDKRAHLDGALTFKWYALEDTSIERSLPAPVVFSFSDDDEKTGHYILLVSEYEDMRDPRTAFTDETTTSLYNLKADTKYYWCIQKDGVRSEIFFFYTTPDLPRCVRIDGVSNVRDVGGYLVAGGRIRQGLLYRGSELELHSHPTQTGVSDIRALGLSTDLDLRGEAVGRVLFPTSSLLDMRYALIPTVPYSAVLQKAHRKTTRAFFALLAKRSAYPIYAHCWGGADRTGTLFFLLGAFLGMSKNELIYEYEFTSLSRWGTRSRNHPPFSAFVADFEELEGETYKQKATFFFLRKLRLTKKQLESIEDIFIEKA